MHTILYIPTPPFLSDILLLGLPTVSSSLPLPLYIIYLFTTSPSPLLSVEADEIRRLSHSFNKLDLNKNGSLSVDEFLSIPELQQNPLVRRVIDILDTDRNGEVDFQGKSFTDVLCVLELKQQLMHAPHFAHKSELPCLYIGEQALY